MTFIRVKIRLRSVRTMTSGSATTSRQRSKPRSTSTLVVIPGAGHLTLCEPPARVADIVVEALPRDADATAT
jgi:pimeloyl-ACP methyl ester carboxylesterase